MFILAAFSDSHGRKEKLLQGMKEAKNTHGAKGFVFLGDGVEDFIEGKKYFPSLLHWQVQGNCDYYHPEISLDKMFVVENQKIFATHGHKYMVKAGQKELRHALVSREGTMVLFGHTHQSLLKKEEGLWLINPGSIGDVYQSSYAIVKIEKEKVTPYIVQM